MVILILFVLVSPGWAAGHPTSPFDAIQGGTETMHRTDRSVRVDWTDGIQTQLDALGGPGTVNVVAGGGSGNNGAYVLRQPILLRSGQTLTTDAENPAELHLVAQNSWNLKYDAGPGGPLSADNLVELYTTVGLQVGYFIIIDDIEHAGWWSELRRIEAINGNILTLDKDLSTLFKTEQFASVMNNHPMILADPIEDYLGLSADYFIDIVVENFVLDGKYPDTDGVCLRQAGIALYKTFESTISGLTIERMMADGISVQQVVGMPVPGNNVIENCQVDGSEVHGIHVGGGAAYSTVRNNTCFGNGGHGIFLCELVSHCYFYGNTCEENIWSGIGGISGDAYNPDSSNIFEANILRNNEEYGFDGPFVLVNTEDNELIHNVIQQNALGGVRVIGSSGYVIQNNLIANNGGYGLHLEDCASLDDLLYNTIVDNDSGGIFLRESPATITNCTIVGNTAGGFGFGLYCDSSPATVSNTILWNNSPAQILMGAGIPPTVSCSDVENGYAGQNNIDADPMFCGLIVGDYRPATFSPCAPGQQPVCGLIGALAAGCGTVSTSLSCTPSSGTLPFNTQLTVSVTNGYKDQYRRLAAHIDVVTGGGTSYSNYRSGYTDQAPLASFGATWTQNIPAYPDLLGDTIFTIHTQDVTPVPYNQPPYPPAGDTDSDVCTVIGIAP